MGCVAVAARCCVTPRWGLTRGRRGSQTSHEEADAIVVNTCAFVDDAKAESISAILDAAGYKKAGSAKRVVVTGCLAQRYAADLAQELPEVDLVVGFQDYPKLSAELHSALGPQRPRAAEEQPGGSAGKKGGAKVLVGDATVPFRAEWDRVALTPRHSAYLRVAEGCDHKCTFCAIPSFRGRFRSKPWDAVLDEARRLAAGGVKELNLIAEDTNQYGQDFGKGDPRRLSHLLAALSEVEGIHWIRILYAYPSYFTDDLIDAIAQLPKVCKYIDIPLQHIANTQLLAMNRPPRQHTEALLNTLRARIPGLALRTTFICGFPGERQEDHAQLVAFCRDFQFERLGAFAFSQEEGTPAGQYPEQLELAVREARRDELVSQQQRICERVAQARVGSVVDVLVDAIDEEGVFVGRTQLEAPDVDPVVFLHDAGLPGLEPLAVGQMRRCKVVGASMFDLTAHPVA